jgi:enoyl-CoA hydratase
VAKRVTLLTLKAFVSPCEKIVRNSPAAVAATKRALWGTLEQGLTDACKSGANELVSISGHRD